MRWLVAVAALAAVGTLFFWSRAQPQPERAEAEHSEPQPTRTDTPMVQAAPPRKHQIDPREQRELAEAPAKVMPDEAQAWTHEQVEDWWKRNDPVGYQVPQLRGRGPHDQLRTLQWMLKTPQDKIVSAFPYVAAQGGTIREQTERSRAQAGELIHHLNGRGVHVEPLPDDFKAIGFGAPPNGQ